MTRKDNLEPDISDISSRDVFSGDVSSTTQQYLNDSRSGHAVEVRQTNGLKISNDSASESVVLQVTATNTMTVSGTVIATQVNTDTISTLTSGGNLTINPSGSAIVTPAGKRLAIGGNRVGSLFAFDCLAQGLTNTAESVARYGVSDAPNDFFSVSNASSVNGSFIPLFQAHQETQASAAAFRCTASILTSNDVTDQDAAVFIFSVGGGNGGGTTLSNRILYQWKNGAGTGTSQQNRAAHTLLEMLPVGGYADLSLPNALAEKVRISGSTGNISAAGQLSVDNIVSLTASTDLTLSATGSNVVVGTGKSLKITGASSGAVPYFNASAQMVTSVTGTSSEVLIGGTTPVFGFVTSSMVNSSIIVAAGSNSFTGNQSFGGNNITGVGVVSANMLQASTTNGNLIIQPNGTGTQVVITSGKILTADTLQSTTASTDLTLSATGTNVVVNSAKTFKTDNLSSTSGGAISCAVEISGQTPTSSSSLTTKNYVDTALTTQLNLLNARYGSPVADIPGLQAVAGSDRFDGQARVVESLEAVYIFNASASSGGVAPNTGTGQWFEAAASTQVHDNLSGLQGGNSSERYHLSLAEHDGLTSGSVTSLHQHAVATDTVPGFMDTTDRVKLDSVDPGAQVNPMIYAQGNQLALAIEGINFGGPDVSTVITNNVAEVEVRFTGDVGQTWQGYLSNSAGLPILAASSAGFTVGNGDNSLSLTMHAIGIQQLLMGGSLTLQGNLDIGNNQATNFRVENVSSAPSAGNIGRLAFNTTTNELIVDDGSSWQNLIFTGDLALSDQGFLNNSTSGTPVAVQDSDGLSVANDAGNVGMLTRSIIGQTTDATQTEIAIDSPATKYFSLNTNTTHAYVVYITARGTSGTNAGSCAFWECKTALVNNSGTTSQIGSFIKTIIAKDIAGWDIDLSADPTNNRLAIKVTGDAATDITWSGWVSETVI